MNTAKKTKIKTEAKNEIVKTIILPFLIVVMSITLLSFKLIGGASFVSLVVISVFLGLIVNYSDRIKSLSLPGAKLILQDMKETESSVKELAKAVLEVTETSSHGLMLESFDSEAKDKAVEKLRKLTS